MFCFASKAVSCEIVRPAYVALIQASALPDLPDQDAFITELIKDLRSKFGISAKDQAWVAKAVIVLTVKNSGSMHDDQRYCQSDKSHLPDTDGSFRALIYDEQFPDIEGYLEKLRSYISYFRSASLQ